MMRAAVAVFAVCVALASGGASAQTVGDVARKEAELVAVWEKTPLGIRRSLFVSERPPLYGAFKERGSNVFKSGEPLLTYIEPIGFTWTPEGDLYRFGVTIDFVIRSPSGQVLGGQDKFLQFAQTSRNKVRELMVNIDLNVSGAPAGSYVVAYTLHDIGNGKTATVEQAFQIVP